MYILENYCWKNVSLIFIFIIVNDDIVLFLLNRFNSNKLVFKVLFLRISIFVIYLGL